MEGSGRLVEHQNMVSMGPAGESANDCDDRPLRSRKRSDGGVRTKRRAEFCKHLLNALPFFGAVDGQHAPSAMTNPNIQVFSDRKTWDETERLMNEMKLRAPPLAEDDFAGVARVGAGEDFHERRFARPVVAEESDDLPAPDRERYAVKDRVFAEAFRNAA